jgi:hypothetical protein
MVDEGWHRLNVIKWIGRLCRLIEAEKNIHVWRKRPAYTHGSCTNQAIFKLLPACVIKIHMPVKSFAHHGAFWFAVKPRIHPGKKEKALIKEKSHRHGLKKL